MIKLEKKTGVLKLELLDVYPCAVFQNLESKLPPNSLKLILSNNGKSLYSLDKSENYIYRFYFLKYKLYAIEIYPKKSQYENELRYSKKIITILGGENKYSWGEVELCHDVKSQYYSAILKYNCINMEV